MLSRLRSNHIPDLTTSRPQITTGQGMLTLTLMSVRIRQRLQVKVKVGQVAFRWILVELNHLRVRNLKMVSDMLTRL